MKPLPRVVCSIDGSTLPVQDYSFTSVANGGYHEFRGQAPVRKLLGLDASQEAPLTVYHEETGDVLWDGRFVEDPEIDEGVGLISATGPKAELEKAHEQLLFQVRGADLFVAGSNPPHSYNTTESMFGVDVRPGSILFRLDGGKLPTTGHFQEAVLWAPSPDNSRFTRYAFAYISNSGTTAIDIRGLTAIGPSGAGTLIGAHDLSGTAGAVDQVIGVGNQFDQFILEIKPNTNIGANADPGFAWVIYNIRINGIADGDTYYAHQVLQNLGDRLKFNTSLIETSGLNVLPLNWTSSWASLADYIASLLDWRWLVSTVPSPGAGLVQYLEAGPWEREWTLFKGSRARPNLKPQQRRNEAIVTYRDVGGANRQVHVRADPDPLLKYGVTRTIEETLADAQPDAVLATAVATTYAQRYSQKRWVGDIDAADARDDSGRGDARLVKPGDIGRLADWGPSEETFHRIHGVEQTQTTVRYSIESPISAASLIEGAALERARRPSTVELPELESPEPVPGHPERERIEAEIAAAGSVARWQWLRRNG